MKILKPVILVLSIALLALLGYFGWKYLTTSEHESQPLKWVKNDASLVIEITKVSAINQVSDEYMTFLKSDMIYNKFLSDSTKVALLSKFIPESQSIYIVYSKGEKHFFEPPVFLIPIKGKSNGIQNINLEGIHTEKRGGVLLVCRDQNYLKTYINSCEKQKQLVFEKNRSAALEQESVLENIRLYINYKNNKGWDKLFPGLGTKNFGDYAYLGVSLKKYELQFSGLTINADSVFSKLNAFEGQKPAAIDWLGQVSSHTGWLVSWGFDSYTETNEGLKKYWYEHRPSFSKEREEFALTYKNGLATIHSEIQDHILFCNTIDEHLQEDFLLYVKGNPKKLKEVIQKVDKDISSGNIETESYYNYNLFKLNTPHLIYYIFGHQFENQNFNWGVEINNHLVFSNSPAGLKKLINDIDQDYTWQYNVKVNGLIQQGVKESNYSVFADKVVLNNKYAKVLAGFGVRTKALTDLVNKMTFFVTNFSNTKDKNKIFTSGRILISGDQSITESKINTQTWKDLWSIKKDSIPLDYYQALIHPQYFDELFIQDTTKLITVYGGEKGKKVFSYQTKQAIKSKVYLVDKYKNKKWQYIFTTEDKLYVIDRKGRDVEGFPIKIPDTTRKFKGLYLIDYTGKKQYRLVVPDNKEGVWFFDIKGKNLKGWTPNQLNQKDSILHIEHLRIRGRDFVTVLAKETGTLLKRNGTKIADFTYGEASKLADYGFNISKGITTSEIKIVTDSGQVIHYNLKGKQIHSGWLDNTQEHQVLYDHEQKNNDLYLVSSGALRKLDKSLNVQWESKLNYSTNVKVKKYEKFYLIEDIGNKELIILNKNGELKGEKISLEELSKYRYILNKGFLVLYVIKEKEIMKKSLSLHQ